jgi:hypothetical protein
MTQEEIIEMAVKAGIAQAVAEVNIDIMEAFAKLVAEKEREICTVAAMTAAEEAIEFAIKLEREACAKECGKQMGMIPMQPWTVNPYEECAKAIRARGLA